MLSLYLIDYNSVEESAVMGIENISPGDQLILFLNKSTKIITEKLAEDFSQCKTIRGIKAVESAENNALELQLATYLGHFIANHSCYKNIAIISNNKDLNSLVDYWKNKIKINVFPTVNDAIMDTKQNM